jgi:acyl-CoA reductase-like NAD-dependent aldehyde dehydrogenase
MSDYKILIGGKLQQGKGAPIEVVNPANERVIARLNTATPAQLDEAVAAAGDAFKEWRQTPVQTRRGSINTLPLRPIFPFLLRNSPA